MKKQLFVYISIALLATSCSWVGSRSAESVEEQPYYDIVATDTTTLSPKDMATDYYMRGVYYAKHRDDDSMAMHFLKKALAMDSLHAPSMYEIAYMSNLKEDSTLQYIKKAVELDTLNGYYRDILSRTNAAHNFLNDAIFEGEKAMELGLKSIETYQYLATLHQIKNHHLIAANLLDSAMLRHGYQPELVEQKSNILLGRGMNDMVIDFMKDVISSGEESQRYYLALGNAYLRKGDDSLAISCYQRAREIFSEDPAVAYTFMEYYRNKGDMSGYISELINISQNEYVPLESKIELIEPNLSSADAYDSSILVMDNLMTMFYHKYSDSYDVAKLYARHKINMGKIDEALKIYTNFAINPTPVEDAFINVIGIYTYLQKYDTANQYYKKAVEEFPDDNDIRMMGVTIAYGSKDYLSAIEVLKKSVKSIDSDSLMSVQYGVIGDLYNEVGDMKKSYKYYDKSLALDGDNTMVLNNYSYHLSLEERDLEKALVMIERVIELESSLPTYLDTHAWILFKLGRAEEARKVMQRAVALDSSNEATLLDHYAYILLELGNTTMARFYWGKALAAGLSQEEYDKRIAILKNR